MTTTKLPFVGFFYIYFFLLNWTESFTIFAPEIEDIYVETLNSFVSVFRLNVCVFSSGEYSFLLLKIQFLNTWNTKYSQNVTCVWKNILSVKQLLLECSITTELFQKNGYEFNPCNNVRDILYNTDIINCIVKLIVRSSVGKLVLYMGSNITPMWTAIK